MHIRSFDYDIFKDLIWEEDTSIKKENIVLLEYVYESKNSILVNYRISYSAIDSVSVKLDYEFTRINRNEYINKIKQKERNDKLNELI